MYNLTKIQKAQEEINLNLQFDNPNQIAEGFPIGAITNLIEYKNYIQDVINASAKLQYPEVFENKSEKQQALIYKIIDESVKDYATKTILQYEDDLLMEKSNRIQKQLMKHIQTNQPQPISTLGVDEDFDNIITDVFKDTNDLLSRFATNI